MAKLGAKQVCFDHHGYYRLTQYDGKAEVFEGPGKDQYQAVFAKGRINVIGDPRSSAPDAVTNLDMKLEYIIRKGEVIRELLPRRNSYTQIISRKRKSDT